MFNVLRILLFILIVGVVAWLGYFYYQQRRMPTLEDIRSTTQSIPALLSGKVPIDTSALPGIASTNQQAVSQAISEGKTRVDMVLGDAIEVASDSDKPAAQKALDYGRYLYCQQVVQEYEKN